MAGRCGDHRRTWRLLAPLVLFIAVPLAACSDDEPSIGSSQASTSERSTTTAVSAAPTPTTTTTTAEVPSTTSAPAEDPAVAEAMSACEWGDTSSRPGTEDMRTVLEDYTGESTDQLSGDEVIQAWIAYTRKVGQQRADDVLFAAALDAYRTAVDHAARASALDDRWSDLHRGISNYLSYLDSPIPGSATSDEVMGWFEQIRLGCERARALTG